MLAEIRMILVFRSILPVLFCFLSFLGNAQTGNGSKSVSEADPVVFEPDDSTDSEIEIKIFFKESWKYKVGDDSVFSTVGFNDEQWDTLSRGNNVDLSESKNLKAEYGITWFRTKIEVDSSVIGKPLVFYFRQTGSAAEVFIDGKRVAEFGKVGNDLEGEKAVFNLSSKPCPVVFINTGAHLLALRYSSVHSSFMSGKNGELFHGFNIRFKDLHSEFEELTNYGKYFPVIFLFAVFLTLGLVHTIMFFYFQNDKPNLFFGLYCIGISFILFFLYYILSDADFEIYRYMARIAGYGTPLIIMPLIAFYHSIYYHRLLRIFWIMIATYVGMLTSSYLEWKIEHFFLGSLIVMIIIEIFRVHIRALVKGKDGALILGLGIFYLPFAILILAVVAIILSVVNDNNVNMNLGESGAMILIYSLALSVPFSITLYLARNFARINRRLLLQVAEIRELSERTLQQEIEKQRLLEQQNQLLESRVKERTRELADKNELILVKNKEITDNLTYARSIQSALLPAENDLMSAFRDIFILYLPKDIVSGDFYAFFRHDNRLILAAADCTGHGVSGAFMSMIGSSIMGQLVNGKHLLRPSEILNHLHEEVLTSLNQRSGETNDGMDIALCSFDLPALMVEFAGANRPMWLIRQGQVIIYQPDKFPIGGLQSGPGRMFTNNQVNLEKDDCLYLFSDGFADQFGGEQGKKLMTKRLRELLAGISNQTMAEQKRYLNQYIRDWQGTYEQVDDILVIGLRI